MKILELRLEGPEYELPTQNGSVTLKETHWRKLLEQVVNAPPLDAQGQPMGFAPDLMKKRIKLSKIVAKLTDEDTEVEFENAEADDLVAALAGVRWNRVSEWLSDFTDDVNALPAQKEEEPEE